MNTELQEATKKIDELTGLLASMEPCRRVQDCLLMLGSARSKLLGKMAPVRKFGGFRRPAEPVPEKVYGKYHMGSGV